MRGKIGRIGSVLSLVVMILVSTELRAESYPTRPIRLVSPAPPGGATDFMARLFGQKLTEVLGQAVIVDNRNGAGGNIGSEYVARSAPDGYTLLMSYNGPLAINPSLYRNMKYDPVKDFAPIARVAVFPYVVVVNPSLPVKTLKDLIAYDKSHPGQLNFGSGGSGSGGHITGVWFNMTYGTDLKHIPYKGSGPAIQDLLAGRTQLMFDSLGNVGAFVQAQKLRAIALASPERSSSFPNIPTTTEEGFAAMQVEGWYGILAPANTPKAVIQTLNGAIKKILQMPDVLHTLKNLAYEPAYSTSDEFSGLIRTEIKKWAGPVKASGATVD